jgi:7,8-dihydropterin-6-yl-methyl-4-(beta-D-ribofuranosyl)aminobenzene 5'-phosphate synthase
MKLTILVDNYVDSQKLKAEHGLAILIEVDGEKILFDCGQSDLVLSNAKVLGIDLNGITKIVLSHSHYDHTGGLMPLLKYLNREIDIYAHPLIFDGKFGQYKDFNGFSTNRYIGIPERAQTYEKKGARFLLSRDPIQISDYIYLSGQINNGNEEELEDIFFIKENNNFIKDPIHDDISIFINLPELLVIVTGCAHSGILNILGKSKDLKLNNKNLAIIGGLHLSKKDNTCIDNIISELKKYNIKLLVPMHCTGFSAFGKLKNSFDSKCVIGSVGKVLEF